jgi:FKBP-type peptidyl-prolyl cis-trans isomerase FklB
MKMKGLIVMTAVMALILGSCGTSAVKNAKITNQEDSLSYAFGIYNYSNLIQDSLALDPILIAKAMIDGKDNKGLMTYDAALAFIRDYVGKREAAKAEKKAALDKEIFKDYIQQNEAFLTTNKEKSGVITTASGLQYEVIKMGTGPKPTPESTVKVHYAGTLIDGTEFDSSIKRNEPAQFPVGGVIAGWTEALQLMPVGSRFKLYLPQSIAYGATGAGEVIKPYSTLIFEVELLEIVQ